MFYYTRAILCHSLKLPELLRRAIGAKVDPLVLDAAEEGYRRATAAGEGQVNRAQRIHIIACNAVLPWYGCCQWNDSAVSVQGRAQIAEKRGEYRETVKEAILGKLRDGRVRTVERGAFVNECHDIESKVTHACALPLHAL